MDRHGYYATLRVKVGASEKEIKASYRMLAKELHPDLDHTVGAGERFKKLNEAYGVLSDPNKRAEYDELNYEVPQSKEDVSEIEPICCSVCDKVTAQPRYLVFWSCVSIIYLTTRTPTQGIYCAACASKVAWKSTINSALFGWWGYLGLFYTPYVIIKNARGGDRPEGSEEKLLWFNAIAFLSKRRFDLAYALARKVVAIGTEHKNDASELIKSLEDAGMNKDMPQLANAWKNDVGNVGKHVIAMLLAPILAVSLFLLQIRNDNYVENNYTSEYITQPPQYQYNALPKEEASVSSAPTCGSFIPDGKLLSGNIPEVEHGHKIEINNGSSNPSIVNLRDAENGSLLFSFYINTGGIAKVDSIPDGTYQVEYAFGDSLGVDCQSFNNILGAARFPDNETFKTVYTENQVITQLLSYTLYEVPGGNIRPLPIDKTQFLSP